MILRDKVIIGAVTITAIVAVSAAFLTLSDAEAWSYPDVTENDYNEAFSIREQRTTFDMISLVDPENKFVMEIASHMQSPDDVLSFVKKHIVSAKDTATYGISEHWATPTETLFNRAGDCEDSAILVASILSAMGYDPMLLIIKAEPTGHVAVLLNSQYIDQFATSRNLPPIAKEYVSNILGVTPEGKHLSIEIEEIFI